MAEDKFVPDSESVRKIMTNGKTYTEQKVSHYNNGFIVGGVMGLVGLVGWNFGYKFLAILLILGPLLSALSYNRRKNWVKGVEGELAVSEYLNELSGDYLILNDVTLPGRYGNIDHIVIGPTGIFAVETKNLTGSYIIEKDQWLYDNGSYTKEAYGNPGEQVKANTRALLKFLSSEGLAFKKFTFPVVAFINPNLTIKNKPKHYHVMHPSNLQNFILSRNVKVPEEIILKAALLLRPYCVEISYYEYLRF